MDSGMWGGRFSIERKNVEVTKDRKCWIAMAAHVLKRGGI